MAHVYNASLMLELLKGNDFTHQYHALNSVPVPNSSGHWLMVLLLIFFSPFVVTKIIVTLTFAGLVASVGWLRYQTVGSEGLKTSLLIGAVVGFNWMWFMGFYNFMIGVIGFSFTLGLYYRWREKMNLWRAIVISLLLIIVYLSHLISFGILAGSIFILAVFVPTSNLKKSLLWTALAFIPAIPLVISYIVLSQSGGFYPAWSSLDNPYSIFSWIRQIAAADPFVILSRKTFPFYDSSSVLFAFFTPVLWLSLALFILFLSTVFSQQKKRVLSRNYFPFIMLLGFSILFIMFAPDDFGMNNGWILRERIVVCGVLFTVPLYRTDSFRYLKRLAQICLIFVVIFQTSVLWEYSLEADKIAPEFLSGRNMIKEGDSIGSVFLLEDVFRFHASPETNLNTFNAVGRDIVVWDNYEIAYYVFPIIARNPSDRQFAQNFTTSNGFQLNNPNEDFEKKLTKLNSALEKNHEKINTMLVWGYDARVDKVLNNWYESEPYFENGRLRLFRHK